MSSNGTCLVKPDDSMYRAFCRRYSLRDKKYRPHRDPLQRDYTLALQKFEEAVRNLLSFYFHLDDHRILKYNRKNSVYLDRVEYRELDCVINHGDKPKVFLELKFKETHQSTGTTQLRKGLQIASEKWEGIKGLWLNIHMGPVYGCTECSDIHYSTLDDIKNCLQNWQEGDEIQTFWLSGEEIIAQAIVKGLIPQTFTTDLKAAREGALNPLSLVKTRQAEERLCLGDIFAFAA